MTEGYGRRRVRELRLFSAAVRIGMSEADINEAWADPESEVLAGDMDTERWWTLDGR